MSNVVYSVNNKRENLVFVNVFSCLVFLKAVWNNQENLMKLKVLKSKTWTPLRGSPFLTTEEREGAVSRAAPLPVPGLAACW